MINNFKRQRRIFRWSLNLLVLATAFYLIYYYIGPAVKEIFLFILPLLLPFLIAIVLAVLIDPVVNKLEYRGIKRKYGVLLVLLVILLGAGLLIAFVSFKLVAELMKLSNKLPEYSNTVIKSINELTQNIEDIYFAVKLPRQIMDQADELAGKGLELLNNFITASVENLIGILASLPSVLLIIIVALIATYFLSRDKEKIYEVFFNFLPHNWKLKWGTVSGELGGALFGFLRAQTILISITMVQALIGLLILNVNYAVTMAIIIGIADLLPALGPGTVLVPWAVWLIIKGELGLGLSLLLLYGIIIMTRYVLEPKILGDNIGLHPLETLISLYVGFMIFGLLGLIVGPIIMVIIKAVWRAGFFSKT